VAAQDRERYHNIARNIDSASGRLDKVLADVQQLLGEGEGDGNIRASVADARQSLQRLNNSMEKIEKIATNIAEGKGVAGKLLADERLGEKLGNTLESASDYYDKLFKLQLKVNLRSEWQLNQTGSKTYAGFTLLPRPDKYYIFEIVSDPRGVRTQTVEEISTSGGTVSTTRTLTEQRVSFSLQFGKRFGPAAFRIGIIESSGGAGADLYLLKDALKLSVSVFQFARPEPAPQFPRAKLWIDYTFLRYFYATVGTDDFLNSWRAGRFPGGPKFAIGNDVFFGGGIVFTDDDLKALIGAAGSSLSGGATSAR
jgi:phospholipid/cholesterol/gamma-HCH transport system substrate-binding protein